MQIRQSVVIFHEFTHVGGGQTFVDGLFSALKWTSWKAVVITGGAALAKWQKSHRADDVVLLANVYTPSHFWSLLWWVFQRKKLILMVHGVWYQEWQSRLGRTNWLGLTTWKLLIAQGILLCLAHKIVTYSHYSAVLVQSSFLFGNLFKEKLTIIPGMIENAPLSSASERKKTRVQLGLESETIGILAVGRLERRKGFNFLIQAFGKLKKKFIQLKLVLVLDLGITSQLELLSELAECIKTADCAEAITIIISPSKKYLKNIYHAADVFVMSSISLETFGFVTLEALQAGLPVVGFNTGATAEVLGGALGRSWLAKTVSANALVQKLAHFTNLDIAQRKKLRVAGYERAKLFESKIVTQQWVNLLQEVRQS